MFEKIDPKAVMPEYKTKQSAGADVTYMGKSTLLKAGRRALFDTGLKLIANDFTDLELQIRSRSSLALAGILVANSPGTVDMDYTGEIKVILHNTTSRDYLVQTGDRIAQFVFSEVVRPFSIPIKQVERTGGFGSTNS